MKTNIQLIFRALDLASTRHKNQLRKGKTKTPYINHPIKVATILIDEAGENDPVLIISAILHDVVEDTVRDEQEIHALKNQISKEFGAEVLKVVEEVTDDKSLSKAQRKRLQVEHAPVISDRAKKIKLADKISNLREIVTDPPVLWTNEHIQEYFTWAAHVAGGLRGVNAFLDKAFDKSMEEGRMKYGLNS